MEDPFPVNTKSSNSIIDHNIPLEKLPPLHVSIKEQKLVQPLMKIVNKRDKSMINKEKINNNASRLLNQQACRDNVEVTYRVIDQYAVRGMFHAKVQAQGIILSLSDDQKEVKLKATGWFTKNVNLQKWQPYLKKPPLTKGILLKVGSEFWDSKSNWYVCKVN